jgi:hypothetical protein
LVVNFLTGQNLPRSSVFGSFESQNAGVFAFFPFPICFFTDVTDVSDMCTLKKSYCSRFAGRAVGREALGFRMSMVLCKDLRTLC